MTLGTQGPEEIYRHWGLLRGVGGVGSLFGGVRVCRGCQWCIGLAGTLGSQGPEEV